MEMENKKGISDEAILHKIFQIRNHKVMLDSDLANLYEVETKVLNQAVNRNIHRFPDDFMFELTEEEWSNLRSQFVTSSWGGRRNLPKVFTEHGVLMLSSVLNSKRAVQINIQIMRIFVRIRQILLESTELKLQVAEVKDRLENQDKNIELLFRYLDDLMASKEGVPPRKRIGFMPDDL